ncbi:MAG TPA: type II secretion system protein GspL [Steroidobacteraceae bacterium]|jgi:general secretion pathway protein L|nr:type II secretion system protein GspL [Steroidobacteraceae bacterium]
MAEWLVLQLSRKPEDQCGWMFADERGQPLSAPRVGTLAAAGQEAAGRRLAVLVPSGDVLMTDVELPVKSGVRAQQVAPFALEEQLAADIETLHFAVGPRDDVSNKTSVAVVTRDLMRQWTEALEAANLQPEIVCAEAALLPDNPGHTVVLLDRETLNARRAGGTPLALSAADVAAALEASLGPDLATENVIFYSTPQDWHRHASQIEAIRPRCASFKAQLLNAGILPLLASQLMSGQFVNLLSGDYAPKRSLGSDWRRWRLAASLAAALLVVHVSGLSYEWVQQRHSEQQLDDAIGQVARNAIPGDPGTGSVRARVQARLASQSGGSAAGLLPALSAVAQAVSSVNGATVESLNYRKEGMELRLKAHDATSLDRIDQTLRNNGYQADITSGAQNGADYEGHIEVHTAAAADPKPARRSP